MADNVMLTAYTHPPQTFIVGNCSTIYITRLNTSTHNNPLTQPQKILAENKPQRTTSVFEPYT